MFLGFDRSGYPGDEVMQSLWDSVQDLTFVCLYLAPAPSHPNEAWVDAAPTLLSMGWGLVPTYVGQQVIGAGSHIVTADQGKIDAQGAAALAGNAGLDASSVIYLDIENGGHMPSNQVSYVTSWIGEVNANTDYGGRRLLLTLQHGPAGRRRRRRYHPPQGGHVGVQPDRQRTIGRRSGR
jgi:Rv2525c-like, glycoside hydrolase-like domain